MLVESLWVTHMTSNPRFAKYVEQVQQNLALFSISDKQAKTYLRKSDEIADYSPVFLVFEILINDGVTGSAETIRKFDPHVSEKLLKKFTLETAARDIEILDANNQFLKEKGKEVDWENITWSLPDHDKSDNKDEFLSLHQEMREIFKIHQKIRGEHENHETSLAALEKAAPEVNVRRHESDLRKVRDTLKKLVKRYEKQYIPSNLAASGLIYEAWKLGKLQSLGNPEKDKRAFDCLLDALFVHIERGSATEPLPAMAHNLGVEYLQELGVSKLDSGETWEKVPADPWFTCVESSLIYKHLITQTPPDTYVIHFPLILDNYRFVGFCYIYATVGESQEPIEIFDQKKYPKLYYALQSVSETLRFSLRADALDRVNEGLESGERDPETLFLAAVKDYVVCFDVVSTKEGAVSNQKRDSLNRQLLYIDHGVAIYGPKWVKHEHKEILKEELSRPNSNDLGNSDSSIGGLYEDVLLRIDRFQRQREQGQATQASILSHQSAGLISEVWCDENMQSLKPQSQGCLWQLKTLIDMWGNFDLEPKATLNKGPQDYPVFWKDLTDEQLLDALIEVGIGHALRRATYRRSGAQNVRIAEKVRRKALEMRRHPNRTERFREWVVLDISKPTESYSDWMGSRGFVLCFHHCFWQAAYHGFLAKCQAEDSEQSSQWFVQIEIENNRTNIKNRKTRELSEALSDERTARDRNFYDYLSARIDQSFLIEGPTPVESATDLWQTIITPSY